MSCENHKKEVAGIADMRLLAEMIGDLHYKSLLDLLWHLHAKIGNDGLNDSKEGRQKLAESLCMASGDLFQAAKNIRNAWKISEPFMSKREQSAQEGDASKADNSTNAGNQTPITEQGKEESVERILCAAVWFKNGDKGYVHQPKNIDEGFVIAGRRHHNCFSTFAIIRDSSKADGTIPNIQGFITSHDRFVNRQEAMELAKESGQVTKMQSFEELYSEDLY